MFWSLSRPIAITLCLLVSLPLLWSAIPDHTCLHWQCQSWLVVMWSWSGFKGMRGQTEKSCQSTFWKCVVNWEAILWPQIQCLAVMCLIWLNIPLFDLITLQNETLWFEGAGRSVGKIGQYMSNCLASRLPGVINIKVSRKAQSELSFCRSFDQ